MGCNSSQEMIKKVEESKSVDKQSANTENHVLDSPEKVQDISEDITPRKSEDITAIDNIDFGEEEEKAATRIQAAFRGHQVRKKFVPVDEAAIDDDIHGIKEGVEKANIEIESRVASAREGITMSAEREPTKAELEAEFSPEDKDLYNAATRIQASFRGHQVRKQSEKPSKPEEEAPKVFTSVIEKDQNEDKIYYSLTDPNNSYNIKQYNEEFDEENEEFPQETFETVKPYLSYNSKSDFNKPESDDQDDYVDRDTYKNDVWKKHPRHRENHQRIKLTETKHKNRPMSNDNNKYKVPNSDYYFEKNSEYNPYLYSRRSLKVPSDAESPKCINCNDRYYKTDNKKNHKQVNWRKLYDNMVFGFETDDDEKIENSPQSGTSTKPSLPHLHVIYIPVKDKEDDSQFGLEYKAVDEKANSTLNLDDNQLQYIIRKLKMELMKNKKED